FASFVSCSRSLHDALPIWSSTMPRCSSSCPSSYVHSRGLLAGRRADSGAQELEILVLRHQLRVLRRKTSRPTLKRLDRVLLAGVDRKSTRLNSSHQITSYA